jgi:hypothetical protein
MYVEKLEQVEEVKSISVELFDELMRVGTVASSMTRLHEAISNCMIEIDMKERSVGTQRELYLLGAERRFQPYRFESHAPFDFASRPFR